MASGSQVRFGINLVVGIWTAKQVLRGFPSGRVRIVMRSRRPARVYVRTADGIHGYYLTRAGDGAWVPAICFGVNRRIP